MRRAEFTMNATFLTEIQVNPTDELARLAYADWLDERGDAASVCRADFLRLHLALTALAPDHPHRWNGEQELSLLRAGIDAAWLAVVEPERPRRKQARPSGHRPPEDDQVELPFYASCVCMQPAYEERKWTELELHTETQDTECDAWKRLVDLVEQAARDGRSDFEPLRGLEAEERSQIVTLPPSIGKLKEVRRLYLYGSHLVRIPPEIGEMTALEKFDPYTSYRLHWFPYEITRCPNLRDSRVSTRALYGNEKYWPPFPRLRPRTTRANGQVEPEGLSLKRWPTESVRACSVCGLPFEDRRVHRVWITLRVATDDLPLLVNACSPDCIKNLPPPAKGYLLGPHRGGLAMQPPGEKE
jgi:uncharacterized protein (TIGR02996 family)